MLSGIDLCRSFNSYFIGRGRRMNWISVKDKLPEAGEYVLVRIEDQFYPCATLIPGCSNNPHGQHCATLRIIPGVRRYSAKYGFHFKEITHWQSMPSLEVNESRNTDKA